MGFAKTWKPSSTSATLPPEQCHAIIWSASVDWETKVMKFLRIIAVSLCSALTIFVSAQTSQPIPVDTARKYFAEAQSLCIADHGRLWGISLCGPMMFVDPGSRYVVANHVDAKGLLKADAGVFVGVLPRDQNIANTA